MQELFFKVVTDSSTVIQIVLVILAVLSVASWTVIFIKLFTLVSVGKQARRDYEAFEDARDLTSAMRALDRSGHVHTIGMAAVRELKRIERTQLDNRLKSRLAMENVSRALRQGIGIQMTALQRSLPFLGTCASASPLLGLFGTVWGIMRSFQAIGMMKSASLAVVGPGIAEALTTTVLGLIVAIPAAIAYNTFVGMAGSVETTFSNFGGAFLNRMQRELPWETPHGEVPEPEPENAQGVAASEDEQ